MPDNPIVTDIHGDGVRAVLFADGRIILSIPADYTTCRPGRADVHIDTPAIVALTNLLNRLAH